MKSATVSLIFVLALVASSWVAGPLPVRAGVTFTVDSYLDNSDSDLNDGLCADLNGDCTLRAAIQQTNFTSGHDTIKFDPGLTLSLWNELPLISDQLTIDASEVWDAVNDKPGITIEGNGGNYAGLRITADSCTIYGLYIYDFGKQGIYLTSAYNTIGGTGTGQRNVISGHGLSGVAMSQSGAHHNVVQNNYIGLNPAGDAAQANGTGIYIADGAHHNTIGGGAAGTGNYISGNTYDGIEIINTASDDNQLGGNIIGLAVDGSTSLANGRDGVYLDGSLQNTHIGGPGLLANTITSSGRYGIYVGFGVSQTEIKSNTINSNVSRGIQIFDSSDAQIFWNTIAYNFLDGIRVDGSSALRNLIGGNSIHDNGAKGIELVNGGNAELAAPNITAADSGSVSGTAPGANYIEIYSDHADEGEIYHDQCIIANTVTGQFDCTLALTGPNVTALAYDSAGNTSEFSAPYAIGSADGTCSGPLPLACGQQVSGDTSGYSNDIGAYSCIGWDESGPDVVYSFTLAPGKTYTVTATLSNLGVDLDVFLLSATGCAAGQCLAAGSYGNDQATAAKVAPGTYYVAVDGYMGAAGSYDLSLACTGKAAHRVYLPLVVR